MRKLDKDNQTIIDTDYLCACCDGTGYYAPIERTCPICNGDGLLRIDPVIYETIMKKRGVWDHTDPVDASLMREMAD